MNLNSSNKKTASCKLIAIIILLWIQPVYLHAKTIQNLPIRQLLGQYQQAGDLSAKTKKETAGTLIVFTRQDLHKMKIKSLSELIDLLPATVYSENALGYSDIAYLPYQLNTLNPVVVYINDRVVLDPFGGNGFQVLAQMDTGYIDHVEVYQSLPSFEIGPDSASTVIKIYTKKGYRENATVASSSYSTYGTTDNYIYQGKGLGDLSYFIYLDNRKLNRKNYYHNNHKLSRDKRSTHLWAEVENRNFRFEMQGIAGTLDNFIGNSWDMSVRKNKTNYDYFYSGLYYNTNDRKFRAYINYSKTITHTSQISDGPLGYIYLKNPFKFYYFYNYENMRINEDLLNTGMIKKFNIFKNDTFLIGSRYRYERFRFKKIKLGKYNEPNIGYNSQSIFTGYVENKLFIGKKNSITSSLKLERHINNGNVEDYNLYGYRFGYIYNSNKWTFKTFYSYSKFPIAPYILYRQKKIFPGSYLEPRKGGMFTGEIIRRYGKLSTELELGKAFCKDCILFNGKYINSPYRNSWKFISSRIRYDFDAFNSIRFGGWIAHMRTQSGFFKVYGGHLTIFNSVGRFSFFNTLIMRKNKYIPFTDHDYHWIYNTTVIYSASRNLSLYIKGVNLFNDSTTSNYIRINPVTHHITRLNGVSDYDRRIWVGLEYKF